MHTNARRMERNNTQCDRLNLQCESDKFCCIIEHRGNTQANKQKNDDNEKEKKNWNFRIKFVLFLIYADRS